MDLITKNLVRGVISTIGTAKIAKMAEQLLNELISVKKTIPLLEGETDIIGILYEVNGLAHFAQAAIKDNEAGQVVITRYISVNTLNELIQTHLKDI
jgi:hypothetical protein